MDRQHQRGAAKAVSVPVGGKWLEGDLESPSDPDGLVLFAHGSGSSRHSPRNQAVARALRQHGFATLLVDLLTEDEEAVDARTADLRFDIPMLAARLVAIVDWLRHRPETASLPVGLFGASTGGGAALVAAAACPTDIAAVVSRGGRPDLAGTALPHVSAPTLLIVGGRDTPVIQMNRDAMARMRTESVLEIVPNATHLFEEPGALEAVAALAAGWFERHLRAARSHTSARAPNPPPLRDPEGQLERAYIDEFLRARGYDSRSVESLPEPERKRLLTEASTHAAARLTEVEARAHFVHEMHSKE